MTKKIGKRRKQGKNVSQPQSAEAPQKMKLFSKSGMLLVFGVTLLVIAGGMGVAFAWIDFQSEADQFTYEVVEKYPHDENAFTQGLAFSADGELYESTGLNGASTLRHVDLKTGAVSQKIDLPANYFGEGMTVLGDEIFMLTWKGRRGFVADLKSFSHKRNFTYTGQGWGLTHDGTNLIMSDGTEQLRFMDPSDGKVVKRLIVKDGRRRIQRLNELEMIDGLIYANIWKEEKVAVIDPSSGQVSAWIDFSGLHKPEGDQDVLNGIAYDPNTKKLLVTGKNWPNVFEVRLKKLSP